MRYDMPVMDTEEDNDTGLDFGAGNVVVLPSRCLRIAKIPTDCDICAAACPASAITPKPLIAESEEPVAATTGEPAPPKPKLDAKAALDKKLGIAVGADCIHCATCTAACPVESLSTTKHHFKGFEKEITDKAAKLEGLAISCARSLYGVSPRLASQAVSVPCLAALNAEAWLWASTVTREAHDFLFGDDDEEAAQQGIESLKVYLPALICDECPVNCSGDAEAAFMAHIAEAESWGADTIELISDPEELAPPNAGKLMSALSDASAGGKREAVEQLASSLRRSWKSAGDGLSLDQKRTEYLAKKKKRTPGKPVTNANAPRPFGKRSQRRRLLRLAIEQEASLAANVELLCAGTSNELCTGCGACVDACSLGARRLIRSSSAVYYSKLPEEKRPQGEMGAVTDQLCCMGCSACVLVCPTGACTLDLLSGKEFVNLRQS